MIRYYAFSMTVTVAILGAAGERDASASCSRNTSDLTYCGGPLLATSTSGPTFVPVFWGPNVNTTIGNTIVPFLQGMLRSNYLSWLQEYEPSGGAYNGLLNGSVDLTEGNPWVITPSQNYGSTVTQSQIVSELGVQLGNRVLPAPTATTLYILVFPPGVDPSSNNCGSDTGYHNQGSANGFSFYYAVFPDPSNPRCARNVPGITNNSVQQFEVHLSHEVVEAMTDSAPESGWASSNTNNPSDDGEIGDLCEDTIAGAASFVDPVTQTQFFGQYEFNNDLEMESNEVYDVGYTSLFPTGWNQNDCYTPRFRDVPQETVNVPFDSTQRFPSGAFRGAIGETRLTDFARIYNSSGQIGIDMFANDAVVGRGGFTFEQNWGAPGTQGSFFSDMPFFAGDFDGDGFTDIEDAWNAGGCIALDVHRNTQTQIFTQVSQAGLGTCFAQGYWSDRWYWVAGDFNGDGKTDIATIWGAGTAEGQIIDLHLSTGILATGQGFTQVSGAATHQGATATDGLPPLNSTWLAGDVNGDGLTDLIEIYEVSDSDIEAQSVVFHLNAGLCTATSCTPNGNAFGTPVFATYGGQFKGNQWVAADFDGNGTTDFTQAFPDLMSSALTSVDVFLTDGSITPSHQRWAQGLTGWNARTVSVGDVDGNGTPDLFFAFASGSQTVIDTYLKQ